MAPQPSRKKQRPTELLIRHRETCHLHDILSECARRPTAAIRDGEITVESFERRRFRRLEISSSRTRWITARRSDPEVPKVTR